MKIKNTFNTGKMNKDVDERLIKNGEYTDAKNIRVLNTSGSDGGAVENEKGNVKLSNLSLQNNPECIGSIADESDEKIYWFVVNDLGYSYIYEYDRVNEVVSRILADERSGDQQVLGFDKQNKIVGVNVFYNIPKKEKLLIFTDNLNQPRCVNINRAKGYGLSSFIEDDINLYKKPPYESPKVTPVNSLNADENSVRERFFSFSYRYKYLDGEFSALSSFTNYQFVNSEFDLDYQTFENKGMLNIFNSFKIKYNTGDERVTDIQICFKTTDDNNIYIAESINKKESSVLDNVEKNYIFTNKKIHKTLAPDEITRSYDNVPLKARAQDIIEDRLVFGNYTIQYDLKENENDDNFLSVDYFSNLKTETQGGDTIPFTFTDSNTKSVLDFTDFNLKKGFTFFLNVELSSPEQGTSPDTYGNGEFDGSIAVVLENTYSSATDFANSDEFSNAIDSLSLYFSEYSTTTPPDDTNNSQYGDFSVFASDSTSITILTPTITHVIDDTPGDDDITDGDTTDSIEVFSYVEESTSFRLSENISNASLKSLQSYEVGLVYLDKYGRYSSVIPSKIVDGHSNTLFVPQEYSVNINTIKTTINSNPPFWADRYKFFIKATKQNHYNIFATIFYEEGVFRWVLLEGANLGKVESGDYLYVKSDDNGPIAKETKVKVIEVATKNAADIAPNSNGGWIEGNEDSAGNEIIEKVGTYMKVKPVGFTMDYNPYNFSSYDASIKLGGFFQGSVSGYPTVILPKEFDRGLAANKIDDVWQYQDINFGSEIKFNFLSYEDADSDDNDTRTFVKNYKVEGNYSTDADGSAFWKWLDAETSWYIPNGESYYTDLNDQFKIYIHDTGTYADSTFRPLIRVQSTEYANALETAYCNASISLQLVSGLLIFETVGAENDTEIYYETEQTFKIENGLHKGNAQDQTSSLPAICDLNFFNCFSFGNGLESINVRDDRFTYKLNTDFRPNIALEQGYKELNVTNGLIHSGSFNENSGYNALNEFNSSRGITKNIDNKYGSIQKIFSRERDLIVFQEDRVSKILYGKTILTSPDGTGSLSQIESVLGQDVPYNGEYGISKDPESFSHYQGKLYFTDTNRGSVLRLGGNGIEPISYAGMKSFFKIELYDNKNNFNLGGFDPRYHQYVLSMGSENKSVNHVVFECGSTFTKTIDTSFNYDLKVSEFPGTTTLNYDVSGSVNITIVYNGVTHTFNSLNGTGSVTFDVISSDLDVTDIADVTISKDSVSSAVTTITHECSQVDILEVVLLVVNDEAKENKTIINRYKHDGTGIYNSDNDIFDADEVTRFETISGGIGTDIIPDNGDTVTISSLRQIGIHSGDFNECNSLGYLVSDATGLTVQNIIDQATYPNITNTETAIEEENTVSFVFNRSNTSEKLYLVWNYIDTLPVLANDNVVDIPNGGSSIINVVSNDSITIPYTISIGTNPVNGTAVVNQDNTITYTHGGTENLTDRFTYIVSRGGTCTAEATVFTRALSSGSTDRCREIYVPNNVTLDPTSDVFYYSRDGVIYSKLMNQFPTTQELNGITYYVCSGQVPQIGTNGGAAEDLYPDIQVTTGAFCTNDFQCNTGGL